MATLLGFLTVVGLIVYFQRRLRVASRPPVDVPPARPVPPVPPVAPPKPAGPASWREAWQRQWQDKWRAHMVCEMERHAGWHLRHLERKRRRYERWIRPGNREALSTVARVDVSGDRRRRHARAEAGFYIHFMSYLGVIAFLALVNLLTSPGYPWFLWPALGWGLGLFFHYMGVFGTRMLQERWFEPALEREVRRETVELQTEKRASIDELSSTIAHEIRNPIAAAKSLVQQMGEDPTSVENVQYAELAVEELDRVERRISHLLRYAKEEDYAFAPVNLAQVVDSALTQLRAKLDAAKVAVARNYIAGPTVLADGEKLRQVFANILDNAVDALADVAEGRRLEVFLENGARKATVRVRDNGCGIPPERIDRVFNPFFTTKDRGTGLGMAISRKIVEAHEGSIDVVSEPGRGTEFVVTLPLPAKA